MKQDSESFGACVRRLRLEAGYGLRRFAGEAGFQPSNLSNMERGRIPPPKDPERLEQLADALGLAEDSDERRRFFDLAAEAHSAALPADVGEYARRRKAIPVLLRTAKAKKLTDEQFRQLIEHINEHF
jgi:transcriptional regulator with XRE-family HTH domain